MTRFLRKVRACLQLDGISTPSAITHVHIDLQNAVSLQLPAVQGSKAPATHEKNNGSIGMLTHTWASLVFSFW